MGEHLLCKQGVRGSNPLTSTNHLLLAVSLPILNEYRRVLDEMTKKRPSSVLGSILEAIELHSEMVKPVSFTRTVCSDPDDDKFLEAAVAANADYVVSGDAALLSIKNHHGIRIVRLAQFQEFNPGGGAEGERRKEGNTFCSVCKADVWRDLQRVNRSIFAALMRATRLVNLVASRCLARRPVASAPEVSLRKRPLGGLRMFAPQRFLIL